MITIMPALLFQGKFSKLILRYIKKKHSIRTMPIKHLHSENNLWLILSRWESILTPLAGLQQGPWSTQHTPCSWTWLRSAGCSSTHGGNTPWSCYTFRQGSLSRLSSPLSTVLSASAVVTEPGNEALPENLPKIKLCLVTAMSRP